jgi:hypothetical protein
VVDHAESRPDGTLLVLRDGGAVRLGARPDPTGPRRVGRVLRRVERVDVSIDGGGVHCCVTGVGHRRRCSVPVALATALSLAVHGVVTTVSLAVPATEGGR